MARRPKRTPDELIRDLELEIQRIKEAAKAKKSPARKQAQAAFRSLEKAIGLAGEEDDKGFVIIDKRASASEEEPAPDAPAEAPGESLPKIDFSTFCLSLAHSGLVHLGVAPDPATGQPVAEKSPVLARQSIDTLELLQAKTQGNLDDDEEKLLQSLLYELRMRFVEAQKG